MPRFILDKKNNRSLFSFILLFGLFIILSSTSFAQNNTSPYSILGIGEIEQSSFDKSSGMADAGTALFSPLNLYNLNPASYSRLNDHFFTIQAAGRFEAINYKGAPVSSVGNSSDMQMEKIAMSVKVKKYWGASVGLMPLSNSNYSFYGTKNIDGSTQALNTYYTGTGGLHKAYFANAFTLIKNHLSAGFESSFIFGSITQNESIAVNNIVNASIGTQQSIYYNKPSIKFGVLYNTKVFKKSMLSLGATLTPRTNLNTAYYLTVTDTSLTTGIGETLISDSLYKYGNFTLPTAYTAGAALNINNKYTFSVDYRMQKWNDLNYSNLSYRLVNSNRISAGFEFSKKTNYKGLVYEKYYLQFGFYYDNTYIQMNNTQLNDKGITLGIGTNSKRSFLSYHFNLQLGSYGTTQNNLIKEYYTKLSLILTYKDLWAKTAYY